MQLTSMASSAQLPCLATTAGVSAREKFVYWHDAIARNLLDLDFGLVDETPFEATFSAASVDALSISTVKASAHKVSRTKASIARSASDHILLNFVLAGSVFSPVPCAKRDEIDERMTAIV